MTPIAYPMLLTTSLPIILSTFDPMPSPPVKRPVKARRARKGVK